MKFERKSGVLLHPTSLPGTPGIGTIGETAYKFIDWLSDAGQTLWQILPLGPTGYGDSPYASFSTFAGNPLLIDLDLLVKKDAMEDVNRNLQLAGTKFSLSTRESEVLKELLDGRTNSEISESLSVSLSTVKKHVYSIFNKIGVNSRAQLLTFVYTM